MTGDPPPPKAISYILTSVVIIITGTITSPQPPSPLSSPSPSTYLAGGQGHGDVSGGLWCGAAGSRPDDNDVRQRRPSHQIIAENNEGQQGLGRSGDGGGGGGPRF